MQFLRNYCTIASYSNVLSISTILNFLFLNKIINQTSCLNKSLVLKWFYDWNEKNYRIWFLPTSGISSFGFGSYKIISVNWLLCYRFFVDLPVPKLSNYIVCFFLHKPEEKSFLLTLIKFTMCATILFLLSPIKPSQVKNQSNIKSYDII